MKRLTILFLFLSLCACMQTENSNSLDASLSAEGVRGILSQNCKNCHVYSTQTDDELIDAGLIVPGDPENSKLYYRLAGSSGANGPKNMPSGGSLTVGEVEQIRAWIEGL
jgi:hypothetical protein